MEIGRFFGPVGITSSMQLSGTYASYPFVPPVPTRAKPLMKYFWAMRNMMIGKIIAMIDAAMNRFHSGK